MVIGIIGIDTPLLLVLSIDLLLKDLAAIIKCFFVVRVVREGKKNRGRRRGWTNMLEIMRIEERLRCFWNSFILLSL